MSENNIYQYSATLINKNEVSLADYQGKVLLIVNTASKCGLTPQFEGLENLYKKYQEKGLVILGFPCDQFANQEFAEDEKIDSFCKLNYGVTFPMFSKIAVNGEQTHPIFKYLKKELPGFIGLPQIKWNFTKFLLDQKGNPVKRYAPTDKPEDIEKDIVDLL